MKKQRVVVVTGGTAGVGRAVARQFADLGADVAVLARGHDGLEATREDIEARGRRALALHCDVASADQVEEAASVVEHDLGPIDIWVNNAMTSVFARVIDMRPSEYRRVMEVTFLGTVNGTLAALARMRPRNAGVIVQVGSALALRSIPLQSAYCAAKHAMRGFTTSLRTELMHDHSAIRVVMVHLPAVNTPQFGWVKSRLPRKAQPVPPIYQPEVAAEGIVHAALHDVGREMIVGWPTLRATKGNQLAPALLDRYLARTGFDSQQTAEAEDPMRPDNLWEPVPGDHGAHGAFDARARTSSSELWARRHRWSLAAAGAGLAALGWVGMRRGGFFDGS